MTNSMAEGMTETETNMFQNEFPKTFTYYALQCFHYAPRLLTI